MLPIPHFGQRFSPSVEVGERALRGRVLAVVPLATHDQDDRQGDDVAAIASAEQPLLVHVRSIGTLVPLPAPDHHALRQRDGSAAVRNET